MKTINNTRLVNSKLIIEHILFSNKPVSQNELLNSLNLDNSTIKRICDTLINEGIIVEDTIKLAGKGRRPKAYSINANYKNMTVLLLGTEKTQIFNYTIDLTMQDYSFLEYDKNLSFEQKLDIVINTLSTTNADICYIITSGSIDSSNRELLRHYRFNINNFNISEYFESKLNIPTFAENNMNAFAINYLYTKNSKSLKNFAVLSAEQGIGAGFILDGDLYRGFEGNAGEIGHLYYQDTDTNCYCERNGCIEKFLSTQYFSMNNLKIDSISDWTSFKQSNPNEAFLVLDDLSTYATHLLRNLDVTLNINTCFVSGLIFEILMEKENFIVFCEKLKLNQINANLILTDNKEENFHYGGAILAALHTLNI